MSTQPSFDYDRFIVASEERLDTDDMRAIRNNPTIPISRETMQRMIGDFYQYDAPHLAYAIDAIRNRAPDLLASHLPRLFVHGKHVVEAAANRALRRLPLNCLDENMINALRQAIASQPVEDQVGYKNIIPYLEDRIEKGENEVVSFDYDRFMATQGVPLFRGDMLTPLNDQTIPVPHETIERLINEFSQYDPPHLIYAMGICEREPGLLAPLLPGLLTHADSSVKAAASRALRSLPIAYLDEQMMRAVRAALAGLPEDDQRGFERLIPDLEAKLAAHHAVH